MSLNLSTVLSDLITVAKTDAAKLVLPILSNFLNSIATNPSEVNIVIQLAGLQGALLTAIPSIEQDELKTLAAIIQTEAANLLSAQPVKS